MSASNKSRCAWAFKVLVALIFIFSAVSKLASLGQFEITIIQQKLVENRMVAAYGARALVIIELWLGLCLLLPWYSRRIFLPSTFSITIFFTGYLGYLALFTDNTDCGCFGDLIQMTPVESIVKNLVILGMIALAYRFSKADPPGRWWVPGGMLALIITAICIAYPVRVIGQKDVSPAASDADAPRLVANKSRFAIFNASVPVGSDITFTNGRCLAAFLSLECDHCKEVAGELGILAERASANIYFVFYGDEALVADFFLETNTNFPYIIPDEMHFFDYIGNAPPRIYALSDGNIVDFWDLDTWSANKAGAFLAK